MAATTSHPESRIGYRFVLGGTKHFSFYEKEISWPVPIGRALRAMEDKLFDALGLPAGSQVMDAGCGVGQVALHMARRGLRVTGIDVVDHHIAKTRQNVARSALPPGQVTSVADGSLDGAYTMETFVHATDPEAVLAGFHRILRPGGRLAVAEALGYRDVVNKYAAMPANQRSQPGVFKRMLEGVGFDDVVVRDYSPHIRPMLRLFWLLAAVPNFFIPLLRLERLFINTFAGAQAYRYHTLWRYVAISATKPREIFAAESAKTK
ncbi:S-adenosyl-L-methionine-dependent methyltransferase [Lasiosphaeria miniovina]|uniref:S-adenosyl-L-methionine-dependent methyltransferase n=1 Tax=Lasiosphaeria miniovina TaxID=1954250 RepID=A0AA39ZYM3_9PEZI|nr:S-adenosyl-L-methionine-dependent methyltransferase [Lasiosphaeria miniovina]KAK0706015.1 S-adenosyl-L-methionine-dependent methyltransferase [Lasiosphaeria miniovina]